MIVYAKLIKCLGFQHVGATQKFWSVFFRPAMILSDFQKVFQKDSSNSQVISICLHIIFCNESKVILLERPNAREKTRLNLKKNKKIKNILSSDAIFFQYNSLEIFELPQKLKFITCKTSCFFFSCKNNFSFT